MIYKRLFIVVFMCFITEFLYADEIDDGTSIEACREKCEKEGLETIGYENNKRYIGILPYKKHLITMGVNRLDNRYGQIMFQFGFKHELWRDSGLYGAYSIYGLWSLYDFTSGHFEDINHNPELFYEFETSPLYDHAQIGYEHMSNGLDNLFVDSNGDGQINEGDKGNQSRSFHNFNVKYYYDYGYFAAFPNLSATVKFWWNFVKKENSDIDKYWGNSDIKLSYRFFDKWKISLQTRGNPISMKGRFILDGEIPLRSLSRDKKLYWRFFHGYGESELNYNRKDTSFRVGVILPTNFLIDNH